MLEVHYKCQCMAAEACVRIPYRAEDRDVVEWMEDDVISAVSADHAARSPLCRATAVEYLKVPIPENAPHVGGKPVVN